MSALDDPKTQLTKELKNRRDQFYELRKLSTICGLGMVFIGAAAYFGGGQDRERVIGAEMIAQAKAQDWKGSVKVDDAVAKAEIKLLEGRSTSNKLTVAGLSALALIGVGTYSYSKSVRRRIGELETILDAPSPQ